MILAILLRINSDYGLKVQYDLSIGTLTSCRIKKRAVILTNLEWAPVQLKKSVSQKEQHQFVLGSLRSWRSSELLNLQGQLRKLVNLVGPQIKDSALTVWILKRQVHKFLE